MELVLMLLKDALDLCISHYFIFLTNPCKVEFFQIGRKLRGLTPYLRKEAIQN